MNVKVRLTRKFGEAVSVDHKKLLAKLPNEGQGLHLIEPFPDNSREDPVFGNIFMIAGVRQSSEDAFVAAVAEIEGVCEVDALPQRPDLKKIERKGPRVSPDAMIRKPAEPVYSH